MSATSASPRKVTPVTNNKLTPDQPATNGSNTASRGHARSPSTSSNGVSRSPSLRGSTPISARASVRKPGRSNLSMSSVPRISHDPSDDEARAQNATLIEELKEQLDKAVNASKQYKEQLDVVQMRLDDAVKEQGKLEEQAHEQSHELEAQVKELNTKIQDQARQIRNIEQERIAERKQQEEDLQATVQRLKKESALKDMRINAEGDRQVSRSSSFRSRASPDLNGQFAPSSQIEHSPSRNNSNILLQKDKLIESLKLELGEAKVELSKMKNQGDDQQREDLEKLKKGLLGAMESQGEELENLKKELSEAHVENTRLKEDNESYQLLLGEKTLTGDFTKGDFMRDMNPGKESNSVMSSLADELESVDEEAADSDPNRKLDVEIKSLKDQNKALTLYIERIISRVLQHDGFEHVLRSDDESKKKSDEDLPPTPPDREEGSPQSFMQRAKSSISGPPRSQPSQVQNSMPPPPRPHENPNTAPSIPIRAQSIRASHRRARSEQVDPNAASVIGHMYRGRNSGPISPTTVGPGARQSMFSGSASYVSGMTSSRRPSFSSQADRTARSSHSSITSADAGSTATSSPPRSSGSMNNYTAGVMTQNKLRPLRLVSETAKLDEEEAARRKANRGSWIPWFNRANLDEQPQS